MIAMLLKLANEVEADVKRLEAGDVRPTED
jgi:hypothetical protein